MADILFVHNNFPGQFGQVAYALAQRGHRVKAIASATGGKVRGVEVSTYGATRAPAADIYPLARRIEGDLIRGRAAFEVAVRLQQQGFSPQLIVGHPGWGETLFLRQAFPRARQLIYAEYYQSEDGEIGFDPEQGPWTLDDQVRGQSRNISFGTPYLEADRLVCPTPFQAGLLPPALAARTTVVHEGIDTDQLTPAPMARFGLADGRRVGRETPLITFVARKLEPLRGFHTFLRALPQVMSALPHAQVLIIGSEGQGYGFRAPGDGWKARYLAEVEDRLDLSRLHFTGRVTHADLRLALQASSAHVYFTYPYVLSWSLLEAMACGALVIGSDTAPVRDVVQPGVNGLLCDFFDVPGLASLLIDACEHPAQFAPLRLAARRTAEGYDLQRVCLPAWLGLVDEMLAMG